MLSALINPSIMFLTLSAMSGVLLHDTRLDKATSMGLAMPPIVTNYDASIRLVNINDFHTHHERVSLDQTIRDLKTGTPRINPRITEDKKYNLPKVAVRGHHAFDNYNLPIV